MTQQIQPVMWDDSEGVLRLLDQRALPTEFGHEKYVTCRTVEDVAVAIENMTVRGAPAIGITAAWGVLLAVKNRTGDAHAAIDRLARTRPTAVNLFWALERMKRRLHEVFNRGMTALTPLTDVVSDDPNFGGQIARDMLFANLRAEAMAIQNEDVEANRRLGAFGAELLPDDAVVLTHCNAGALATGGHGTALGILRSAREAGKKIKVFADETRPLLQGARLTAWELSRDGFDVTVITDSMAAALMSGARAGVSKVDAVIVGADRIAANGDTANKIGTYGLAVNAKAHDVPFYVAAPQSTLDAGLATGAEIPIEERDPDEIRVLPDGNRIPDAVQIWNPAFDVTPANLITAIITDKGVFRAPFNFRN